MDWLFFCVTGAAFVGGWWVHSHLSNVAASAAKAVVSATTLHTGTPFDSVAKTVGSDVTSMINKAAGTAPAAPATVSTAALAGLANLGKS